MKILTTLLLSLTSLSAVAQTSVMSFNIRYANEHDGENRWDMRKERVVQKLNLDDPDIIGFQEALAGQVDFLSEKLTDYHWIGVGRDNGASEGEYTPVFYKKNKFDKLAHGYHWLSLTPQTASIGWDAACIRMATWTALKNKETGKNLILINTHFDHVGEQARINSSKIIVALADSLHNAYDNAPIILLGDFNSPALDAALSPISSYFKNAQTCCAGLPADTFIGFPNDKNAIPSVIDHIFVKGLSTDGFKVDTENYGLGFLSDHRSVSCVVE